MKKVWLITKEVPGFAERSRIEGSFSSQSWNDHVAADCGAGGNPKLSGVAIRN